MASVLASRTRLAYTSQVRNTITGQQRYSGWLAKFFKRQKVVIQEPTIAPHETNSTPDDVSLPKLKSPSKKRPLSPESKSARFQQNIEFMTQRLRRRPHPQLSKIAKTTWIRTLAVCQTEEDLRKLMELFPLWRAMNNRFDAALSEAFICRCIMLKKPEIAIEVFGNFAKYNIPLTLAGARKLLHETYETHPLVVPITISTFFPIYRLPKISNDLPCCSMLLSACLKDGSDKAMVIAENLIPSLKWVLTKKDPQPIPKTQEKGDDMPRVWTKWALRKIEEKLSKREGTDMEWLHSWRVRSEHVAGA